MRTHDLRIDMTGAVDLPGVLQTAATVHLPDRIEGPLTVIFGLPGGSYTRGYYDIRRLPGYSQAEYHTDRGMAFVACDHIGIGDSSAVDKFELTIERMATGNHVTATKVLAGLRDGTLVEGLGPVAVAKVIGIGQSMGGCLLTVQQGLHRTFDAIGVLGYGCAGSSFTAPDGRKIKFPAPPRGADMRQGAEQALGHVGANVDVILHTFHAPDEEPALLAADTGPESGSAPWRAAVVPACAVTMMGDGAIAAEAAMIDVPVLLGCGEVDVVDDPWLEPAAFRNSRDVSLLIVPRMRHMHNFARTREVLWGRIDRFAERVAAA